MKTSPLSRISLLALLAGIFIQIGAQLFALLVIVQTLVKEPPKSFQMLSDGYGYDSSIFWDTIPNFTTLLFVIALIGNWKTNTRNWIITSFAIFIIAGIFAIVIVEPMLGELISEQSSVNLNEMTITWFRLDWTLWFLTFSSGLVLIKPVYGRIS